MQADAKQDCCMLLCNAPAILFSDVVGQGTQQLKTRSNGKIIILCLKSIRHFNIFTSRWVAGPNFSFTLQDFFFFSKNLLLWFRIKLPLRHDVALKSKCWSSDNTIDALCYITSSGFSIPLHMWAEGFSFTQQNGPFWRVSTSRPSLKKKKKKF